MNRDTAAYHIGLFILRMNEIDLMAIACRKDVLGKTVTKTWLKKTLSERLKSLNDDLDQVVETASSAAVRGAPYL
ncbi:hypothetical protein [Azospirillum argentinense]